MHGISPTSDNSHTWKLRVTRCGVTGVTPPPGSNRFTKDDDRFFLSKGPSRLALQQARSSNCSCTARPRHAMLTLPRTHMEVDGMVPWKTMFLFKQCCTLCMWPHASQLRASVCAHLFAAARPYCLSGTCGDGSSDAFAQRSSQDIGLDSLVHVRWRAFDLNFVQCLDLGHVGRSVGGHRCVRNGRGIGPIPPLDHGTPSPLTTGSSRRTRWSRGLPHMGEARCVLSWTGSDRSGRLNEG